MDRHSRTPGPRTGKSGKPAQPCRRLQDRGTPACRWYPLLVLDSSGRSNPESRNRGIQRGRDEPGTRPFRRLPESWPPPCSRSLQEVRIDCLLAGQTGLENRRKTAGGPRSQKPARPWIPNTSLKTGGRPVVGCVATPSSFLGNRVHTGFASPPFPVRRVERRHIAHPAGSAGRRIPVSQSPHLLRDARTHC